MECIEYFDLCDIFRLPFVYCFANHTLSTQWCMVAGLITY